ncbi:hypothetical protein LPMP_190240 [Leishmania panamensis]|uniref:Uncharacterized protein n=1 Tax=Leishmania panamensis TaxID=5679 RepID=A0A088S729_LEIPA|nr:hypothetical protein LPMP_190240 [Leishmania panamensis]AIN97366.1 hypothetical protein LPMP_190240 [Leishmania panamensis]
METNRPPSTAKWVSRRTLDSQANNRENSAVLAHPRGSNSDNNPNNASRHQGAEKRKYRHAPDAVIAAIARGSGSVGGAAAADNAPPAPLHTNGGGGSNRFGTSGSWGSHGSYSNSTNSELNHQGSMFGINTLNAHGLHGNGNHNGNSGARRGYREATEPTIPPPPRSVQMGQGTLSAQATAATSRDFIPQPRHAKVNSSGSSHSRKSMEASPPPPGAAPSVPLAPSATLSPGSSPAPRWGFNATPTPRSANGGAKTPNAPPLAYMPTSHFDALAGVLVPKPATSSLAAKAAEGGDPEATAAAHVPPSLSGAPLAFPATATTANTCLASATPSACASAPPRPSAGIANAVNAEPSPLDSFCIGENLGFSTSAFGGSLHSQPSEIETLLGQVECNTGILPAGAPSERAIGSSLREWRSVTDWGIEEAIRTVLPGMDEDENSDNIQGLNSSSGGMAAITGSWHTSGDAKAHLVSSDGVGSLLADFPTSFAASFSEPTGSLPPLPFPVDATSNTIDNLSRAFSTAARVDSNSFTMSPSTTAATPLQRPLTSPGVRLPPRTTPVEAMSMPPLMRDLANPSCSPYTALKTMQPPPPRPTKTESSMRVEDILPGPGPGGNGELFTLYSLSPPTTTSPWLSSGIGEAATSMAPVGRTGDSLAAKPPARRSPRTIMTRPEGLQAIPLKEGSMGSNGGLTTTTGSTTSPALAAARQSSTSSHCGSAPNTPSLRKELSTPPSGSRSQPYTPGGSRPQRPSLSAPLVNRHTITHIFRETPQSLRRRERMEHNHQHSDQALCKDFHWPPHDEADAEHMLRDRNATKLLRHLTIISFSRQHVNGVQELFDTWAKNGIPAPDMGFGAYYFYVKEKSEKLLCMKHNGRGASPGHGYGRCDFESRRPYSTCRYEHVCLFCRSKEHGWFEEGKCQGYQQLLAEMEDLGVTEEDVVTLLNAMERPAKSTQSR